MSQQTVLTAGEKKLNEVWDERQRTEFNADSRSLSVERIREMKSLTWKEVFASLNPSPVFEVIAIFAEGLATNGDEFCSRNDDVNALSHRQLSAPPEAQLDPTPQNL